MISTKIIDTSHVKSGKKLGFIALINKNPRIKIESLKLYMRKQSSCLIDIILSYFGVLWYTCIVQNNQADLWLYETTSLKLHYYIVLQ